MPDTSGHPLQNAMAKFWAPVPWLLEASIVLELGLHKYAEAAIIAGFLVFNAALAYFQESHAQVLPTRLSAVDEAGTIDVLCSDKTGTLTGNQLSVTSVRPMPGFDEAHILGMASLASTEGGPRLRRCGDPIRFFAKNRHRTSLTCDCPLR